MSTELRQGHEASSFFSREPQDSCHTWMLLPCCITDCCTPCGTSLQDAKWALFPFMLHKART